MKFVLLYLVLLSSRAFGFGDNGQVFIPLDDFPFTFAIEVFEEGDAYRSFWFPAHRAEGLMQARILEDGSPDTTFADQGVLRYKDRKGFEPFIVFKEADGEYLTVTNSKSASYLSKIKADGKIDTSFGNNGFKLFSNVSRIHCATRDSSGRMVTVSSKGPSDRRSLAFERYLADGNLDTTFGRQGVLPVVAIAKISSPGCAGIVIKSDQTLVASLQTGSRDGRTLLVSALPDGKGLDSRFARNGILDSDTVVPQGNPGDLKLGANDAILSFVHRSNPQSAGGHFDAYLFAVDANGRLISSFGDQGRIRFPQSFTSKLAVDGEKKIYLARTELRARAMKVYKFLPDGKPDLSFGDQGVGSIKPDAQGVPVSPDGVILDSLNRIVIYGTSVIRGLVFERLLPNGTADLGDDQSASL